MTDLHVGRPGDVGAWHNPYDMAGAEGRLRRAMEHFARARVDVIALTGDLVHRGDEAVLRSVLELCAATARAPVRLVAGNHDTAHDGDRLHRAVDALADDRLRLATPRAEPAGDGVLLAGVHAAGADGWFGSRLRDPPDVDEWGDRPVVLLSHLPALSAAARVAALGLPYPGDLTDRVELEAALVGRRGPTVVLSGHIHARTSRAAGTLLQLTQAAAVEPPFECAVLDLEHRAGTLRVARAAHALQASAAPLPPVLSPAREAWAFTGGAWSSASDEPAGHALHHPIAATEGDVS